VRHELQLLDQVLLAGAKDRTHRLGVDSRCIIVVDCIAYAPLEVRHLVHEAVPGEGAQGVVEPAAS
jgi:hypothetical protein